MRTIDALLRRLESSSDLDPVAESLAGAVSRVLGSGRTKDMLSGTPLGHPAHPALIALPMGAFAAVSVVDATDLDRSGAVRQLLLSTGLATAVPTALTGLSDWSDTEGAERRVGLVHAALNVCGIAAYAASLVARRGAHPSLGRGLALVGAALLGGGGYLGGHMAYGMGVGVDTTAFASGPDAWTEVGRSDEIPPGAAVAREVSGVAILVARDEDGALHALRNRCSHRGGPLSEGDIENGCVTCPWHGSVFDLSDGRFFADRRHGRRRSSTYARPTAWCRSDRRHHDHFV